MIVGDPHAWKSRFITLDERILSRILHVWPTCVACLPGQPDEDTITINLVALLSQAQWSGGFAISSSINTNRSERIPVALNSARAGSISLLLLDQERERYVAYECKRLNVIHKGVRGVHSPRVT